jgi:hypothetical protein
LRNAPVPDTAPYKCYVAGHSDEANGPYVRLDKPSYNPQSDRQFDIWLSRPVVEEIMELAGVGIAQSTHTKEKNKTVRALEGYEKVRGAVDSAVQALHAEIDGAVENTVRSRKRH